VTGISMVARNHGNSRFSPKNWNLAARLHGLTSQKTITFLKGINHVQLFRPNNDKTPVYVA
jgi:hypothetical protein